MRRRLKVIQATRIDGRKAIVQLIDQVHPDALSAFKEILSTSLGPPDRAAVLDAARKIASSSSIWVRHVPVAGPQRPACGQGCSACCNQPVAISMPELLLLLEGLGERRAAVVARAVTAKDAMAGLLFEDAWELRIPCPLLGEGGRCTAYEHRPVDCAAYYSTSAEACAGPADAIVSRLTVPVVVAATVNEALSRALEDVGLDGRRVWLPTALARISTDPSFTERRLTGARLPDDVLSDNRIVAPRRYGAP